jgi:GNAT superfamily N-acetyltransferase
MLEIAEATTAGQFRQFQDLVDEFMEWDTAMSREIGLDIGTMLDFFYKTPASDLSAEYSPRGCVVLATYDGDLAGCGALKELSEEVAELTRVYVRPAFRGRGLGKAIVEAILSRARKDGYTTVCLETAIFMKDAQALYRSLGFQLTKPFRLVPAELTDAEVFMELRLSPSAHD